MSGIRKIQGGGYGKKLKDDYRRLYGSVVELSGRGEMIPNRDSYCELDPTVVDRWGIPVLRFHWKWSDYELNQARHMVETSAEIIEAMGGRVLGKLPGREQEFGLKLGGEIIDEAGTTRMGTSPRTSALNEWCQAHDCKNPFVADRSRARTLPLPCVPPPRAKPTRRSSSPFANGRPSASSLT